MGLLSSLGISNPYKKKFIQIQNLSKNIKNSTPMPYIFAYLFGVLSFFLTKYGKTQINPNHLFPLSYYY